MKKSKRNPRYNPMDQLGGCRVALQDAYEEIAKTDRAVLCLVDYVQGRLDWHNTPLEERATLVGVRTTMRDLGLWPDDWADRLGKLLASREGGAS